SGRCSAAHRLDKVGVVLDAQFGEQRRIVIQRVGREVEAKSRMLSLQTLCAKPGLDHRKAQTLGTVIAKHVDLPLLRVRRGVRGYAEDPVEAGHESRSIRMKHVERSGSDEALQGPLVQQSRIDAPGEVGKVAEAPLPTQPDQMLHRMLADALDRG